MRGLTDDSFSAKVTNTKGAKGIIDSLAPFAHLRFLWKNSSSFSIFEWL
jgi:hypothetical protein